MDVQFRENLVCFLGDPFTAALHNQSGWTKHRLKVVERRYRIEIQIDCDSQAVSDVLLSASLRPLEGGHRRRKDDLLACPSCFKGENERFVRYRVQGAIDRHRRPRFWCPRTVLIVAQAFQMNIAPWVSAAVQSADIHGDLFFVRLKLTSR